MGKAPPVAGPGGVGLEGVRVDQVESRPHYLGWSGIRGQGGSSLNGNPASNHTVLCWCSDSSRIRRLAASWSRCTHAFCSLSARPVSRSTAALAPVVRMPPSPRAPMSAMISPASMVTPAPVLVEFGGSWPVGVPGSLFDAVPADGEVEHDEPEDGCGL